MKTIRMPKTVWQKWDEALRSGEYKQALGALEVMEHDKVVGYCCLGVLQMCLDGRVEHHVDEVEAEDGVPSRSWLSRHGIQFCNKDGSNLGSVLIGSDVDPYLPAFECSAAMANDDKFKTFVEIADAIMECVEFTDEVANG
jgi:hypothetical protein